MLLKCAWLIVELLGPKTKIAASKKPGSRAVDGKAEGSQV
jgi:hypothetical protein